MTRIILTSLLLIIAYISPLSAERLFRSERATYTLREDAVRGVRSDSSRYMSFADFNISKEGGDSHGGAVESIEFVTPQEWLNGEIMLHLEGSSKAYQLLINGVTLAHVKDYITPSDYQITSYLIGGDTKNRIEIRYGSAASESPLSIGIAEANRPKHGGLESAYIYAEPRRRIFDYDVKIRPDSTRKFAWLDVDAIVENSYNYEESITIGFDLFHPDGRLLDYSSRPTIIDGRSRDTVRFSTRIYNADSVRWSPETPALFSVTLLTKHGAIVESYTPIKVGYSDHEMRDGVLYNFGERVELRTFNFNALSNVDESADELYRLKDAGFNALRPSYPQPLWFYDLCDEMGFYIIEQTSINAPQSAESRAIGGSPSNDPHLLSEYIQRMEGSYYRIEQHPSVIAFSLGANSGNGYNMYKSYEWMKSVESRRPIIYDGAQGEWNSDKGLNR